MHMLLGLSWPSYTYHIISCLVGTQPLTQLALQASAADSERLVLQSAAEKCHNKDSLALEWHKGGSIQSLYVRTYAGIQDSFYFS